MSEYILNMFPLVEEEKPLFESLMPDAVWEYPGRSTVTDEQLEKATIIMGWPKAQEMYKAVNLHWLQALWMGVDDYLEPGILPHHVTITTCAGAYRQAVSEHMLATLLSLCRKLPQYRDNQSKHLWKDLGTVRTIHGATVLVVGAGVIGSAFAKLCKCMGAHTVGLKRTVTGGVDGFDELDTMEHLDERLPQADVVALIVPHTPETVHLLDARRIALMKPDAILLSDGRGTVLDQQALAEAMNAGHLWGAALDVTAPEPLNADSPLWDIPNLLLTPHVAGGIRMEVSRKSAVDFALSNFRRYVNREPLVGVARPIVPR
ncbi:MAG: D-2-hydroxyacid dehydrogenase [Oscillospiraceae bacterium]|nr:D-2-hydroxyacid dehydrogenase [Oscillospiraceae bacterium]